MISVIICSKSKSAAEQISRHIEKTIGCEFEIRVIDNADGKYGICAAYNLGAGESKYDNLVFAHEDIFFHTQDWGNKIVNHLNNREVGLVGCTGSVFKSEIATSWTDVPFKYYRSNAVSGWKNPKAFPKVRDQKEPEVEDVAVLDGMFLCMRKDTWEKNMFDEVNLKGFHLYDMDISLRIVRQLRNIVAFDIVVEHYSAGNFDRAWFAQSLEFHKRNNEYLPFSVIDIGASEKKQIQHFALIRFLMYLKRFGFSKNLMLKYVPKLFLYKPLAKLNFGIVIKLLSNKTSAK